MTKNQSPSTARSSRSSLAPRPQINTEFDFESGEGCGIDPGLAIDGPADDGTTDASTSSDLADALFVGEGLEFEGEESSDLGHGVGTDLVGPVAAETARRGSHRTGHELSIRATEEPTLLSTNSDVTDQTYGVLSKQHQVRLGAIVTRKIEDFAPQIPAHHWVAIGPFVRAAITDVEPVSPDLAKKALSVVTTHTHWAWQRGCELDRSVVFDRLVIEEFIAAGCPSNWSAGTRRNMRGQLFKVSRSLLGDESNVPRIYPVRGDNPAAPYSANELAALRSWAKGQRTPLRRRNVSALLALGAGAGLKVDDLVSLRPRDIVEIEGFVIVNVVGKRPRQVPVLADWMDDLLEVISNLSPDEYVFVPGRTGSGRNLVNDTVRNTSGVFKSNTFRLRSTWIVHHLTIGTPLKPLMAAAGVNSCDLFSRYFQFVPDVETSEARRLLRGE